MNNSIFSQNKDLLNSYLSDTQDIGIAVGSPLSLDKVASSLSLYLSLLAMGKNVQIISKTDPIVEYSNLVGIDKIKKSFDGLVKIFTISVPNKNNEIEKVSYKEEGDRVHLNLFASESGISFSEKDLQYIKNGATPSLIFTIGIQSFSELATLAGVDSTVRLVNIDNNNRNEFYGDIIYFDPSFSSISEIVSKIIEVNMLTIDIDIAQNLFDGVSYATSNFTSFETSIYSFECAAFALKNGARRKSKDKQLGKSQLDEKARRFQEKIVDNMPSYPSFNPYDVRNPNQPSQKRVDPLSHLMRTPQTNNSQGQDDIPEDWLSPKVFRQPKNQ